MCVCVYLVSGMHPKFFSCGSQVSGRANLHTRTLFLTLHGRHNSQSTLTAAEAMPHPCIDGLWLCAHAAPAPAPTNRWR